MGFLKNLGLKKKTSASSRTSSPPSQGPPSFIRSREDVSGELAKMGKGRGYVAASGPLTPSYLTVDFDKSKDAKSEGEEDHRVEEEEDDSRSSSSSRMGEREREGEGKEGEDTVGELQRAIAGRGGRKAGEEWERKNVGEPLEERSLRRVEPLLGNRSRAVERGERVVRGGSMRGSPVEETIAAESVVVSLPKAASVGERPARHRRNPSIETILRNMYGGELPYTSSTATSKPLSPKEKPQQHSSGSKSGVLTPRDLVGGERESLRVTKARSGVLTPREFRVGGEEEEGGSLKGREGGGRREGRGPRSGTLTSRELLVKEETSTMMSARSTRIGQVAPRDLLQPDDPNSAAAKPTGGGSGTLQPRVREGELEGVIQAGRSRSGQLLPRDFGQSLSLGLDKFKPGPRSLASYRSVKDIFQGERQQKGAAQRRLSRNKNAVHIPDTETVKGEGGAAPAAAAISSSTGRRSMSRNRGGNDTWQEPIAEENEGGSGQLQSKKAPTPVAVREGPSPARMRLHGSSDILYSPSRSSGSGGGAVQRLPGAPQTASERLAASLALSLASVQAQKSARGGSGVSNSTQGSGHPMSRVRQDGPGDNVLQRPFANVREKYQLQMEELGRGRFGVIRVCLDRKTGEKLACKSISKARLKTWHDADDVRREVTVMELLQGHPHVVSLKGAFEDALNVHLVMELCEGGELFDRIMAKKRYAEQEAAIVCRTVVGVLRYCHALGYIHRDLKPENILLCGPASDTAVKVIDFGVATPFTPGVPCSEEVGTPFYLAPEVLQNSYGPEADIWSAGVVLYILLCGVPPFWAKDTEGIRAAIREGKLDLTSGPWKNVSEPAKDLVRQMLNMDPAARIKGDQILAHPWIANLGRV